MTASDSASNVTAPRGWLANQPYLLLCITALCWAGNAIAGRLAAGHIPPVTLSFLRWSLAFLIILPFAWKHLKRDWRDPRPSRYHDRALDHRHRRLQHPAILVAGTYPGAEHAVAAVGRTAVRRGMVADPARRPADAGASLRDRAVAVRRAGDPAAWRPDHTQEHRVQQGRYHLHRRAGDLRAVFGAVAEAPANQRPVVRRLHLRLRRGLSRSLVDLGTSDAPGDAVRRRQPADAVLCRGVSLDAGLSLLQSRRAVDRRQPRRAVLSCGAGVRIGDGDRLSRRAPATVPHHRLRAGADRRFRGLAQAGERALDLLPTPQR